MEKNNTVDRRIYEALTGIDIKYIEEITDDYEIFDENEGFALGRSAKRKFYAKIAAAAACLVLVAGLMSIAPAIDWNFYSSVPSWNEGMSENDYYTNIHKPEWEYYGKYGACYASLPSGGLGIPSSETVGGLTFEI